MADDERRPDPDALLAEVGRAGRGRLKLFLGAAPGVGKTYEMLRAAQDAKTDGVDVVVGLVETHGRRETEALLVGLEAIPRRLVSYRGRMLPEMDLDAILERRPALVLVDELAHTNVPGERHAKRWQDVEELLAAGIDVHTTLNVQHLDSLNDVVERIAGIKVRETLPDKVVETADEIEVIDVTPEVLQKRLREGKVYVPEQAARAITRFFSRGNLTALREMALRVAAERVDRDMIDYMRSHAVASAWPARDRLLVCLTAGAAERLVRTGKRMADRSRAPWIVLAIGDGETTDPSIERALLLAEQLGAETEQLAVARSAPQAILDYARRRNVSRIVVAAEKGVRLFRPRLHEGLIAGGDSFEITVLGSGADSAAPVQPVAVEAFSPRAYLLGAFYVGLAMPFGLLVDHTLPLANLSLVFLAPVLAIGAAGRVPAAVFTSILAFIAYNYFFTEPRLTLSVIHPWQVLTLAFFLVFSLVVGILGARLNAQVAAMRVAERHTRALYEFTRKALSATSDYDMAWTVVSQVRSSVPVETVLLTPDASGRLVVFAGSPPIDEIDPGSAAAADWAWRQGQRAGWSTDTLPSSGWLFIPLVARERTLGVLGLRGEDGREPLRAADRRLLDTLVDQAALILERARMIAEAAEAQRYSQTEKLRTALLSSVSHDLRTPLVSIIGAVSTLEALGGDMSERDRAELLKTVAAEAGRLNRFIQNLLDMTRLGYGALAVRREWLDLGDIVAAARERLKGRLDGITVAVQIAPEVAMVEADPTLLEQALVNLLDNAARFSPPGEAVSVSAERRGNRLVLAVSDHGPGVPPDRRDRVFDLFWRAENADRQSAGTGLGLAIVRGFVEAMGGRVTVGERDGGGARFEINLPQPAMPVLSPEPFDG
ncbi:sensor histidine kinase KdpD [Acuticoccus sp. M5D2P5]|uniref:sensor histidine kinase n=1 Tax=Acuticoccus kalidii TaxID=2910977 RepID=UPI001F22E06B|nr:sensor histidine kinase KdpD [Acuticoccus kalidii]MCF3933713.1 sensor histidine kinase KdpD [Acuticoccus kalidii]